ncbi:MAG: NHL repeat-containing protein [Bacteroidetes bacterium]|jgi:hypothetical protein|nr:NHL repeat-containing protein [Bacteroidota bacterium]
MAALVAVTLLWLLTPPGPQSRPLLIEVARVEVASSVRALSVGIGGSWYLADPERHEVVWQRPDGTSGGMVGGYGWSLSALDQPSGLATDGNRVYVADRGNHRIVSYDRALRPLSSFATRDTADLRARFGFPNGVAVSGRGDLVVLDGESDEVVGFRPDGRVAFRIGREVSGGPPLDGPTCVSVDGTERLLVGEAGGVRIVDLFGNQLRRVELGGRTVIRAAAGAGGWLAAVSADTLFLVHEAESRIYRWHRGSIVPGIALQDLWSVGWQDGHLIVLSAGSIARIRLEQ